MTEISSPRDEYELINSFTVEKTILIEKYQHKKTKFTIYNIKVGGPLVNCLVVVPTETLSNDGCPHTLEHLVFLGSEEYPFKGYLDSVANLCFATGTNAFTDTDHTGYELETAGSDGFFQALPIYLDHIFYPTITDQAFTTEIHHINDKGENAGVVYCEMQERETKRNSIVYLNILRNIYSTPNGYASETGGLLKDIRELKVETIRDFHKSYYRPDNAALMVVGDINIDDIFKSLDSTMKKIISKGELSPMERPWSSIPTPFSESTTKKFLFPSEDETTAECTLTFEGPKFNEYDLNDSVLILLEYLTSGVSSPVGSAMIDCEDSYGPHIYTHNFQFERNFHTLWFSSCDSKRIDEIKPKFLSIIKNLVETKTIDIERIRDSIHQSKLNTKLSVESEPTEVFSDIIAHDFLYGNNDLEKHIDFENVFEKLLKADENYWIDLMDRIFLKQPCLEVQGIPSIEESKRISKEEADRIEKQVKELGEEKLKEFGKTLEDAKSYNDRPIDEKYFESIKIPSPDSISCYSIYSVLNDKPLHSSSNKNSNENLLKKLKGEEKLEKYLIESNPNRIPFKIVFNQVDSLFIDIRVGFNTNSLQDELRDYLPMFLDLLLMSSIKKDDGTIINHDQVDSLVLKYAIKLTTSIGYSSNYEGGDFAQYCFIACDLKKDYYCQLIELLKDILVNIIIEPERIKIVAKKLLDAIPERKESSDKMVKSVIQHNQFNHDKSNSSHLNYLKQYNFLKNIINILGGDDDDEEEDDEEEEEEEDDDDEAEGEEEGKDDNGCEHGCKHHHYRAHHVEEKESKPIKITDEVLILIDQLKKIQNYFTTKPENVFVGVGGNIMELKSPKDPWLKDFSFLGKNVDQQQELKTSPSSFQYQLINKENMNSLMGKQLAITTPGSSSSTVERVTLNNITYDDVISKEYVALYVALNYLEQLEGAFWKLLRGAGLCYGYRFSSNPEGGLMSFKISRSSNPEMALQVGKQIIQDALDKPLDKKWIDGARSTSINEIANKEKNYASVLENAYFDLIRGWVDISYRDFYKLIFEVTEEDLRNAIKKYLSPLFDDSTSLIIISSESARIESFKKTYPNLQVIDPETYFV
ncbi:hypothetical protein RB653_009335 [Dictyostelium firmibasis]|uniref:Uncharacterized protein n=1 Tax=Dictyostelium firmibasis TaxID=79012 RepID=A0AAN7Z0J6_9MYCE